ncbi:MAG: L,D-transpeptidase, partial [Chloroflexota bacterium]
KIIGLCVMACLVLLSSQSSAYAQVEDVEEVQIEESTVRRLPEFRVFSPYKTHIHYPAPAYTGPKLLPANSRAPKIFSQAFMPHFEQYPIDFDVPITGLDERWVRVDLSEQIVLAYEGDRPLRGFVMSSGLPDTPTVTGTFYIKAKVPVQHMAGNAGTSSAYYIEDVPWVQYFFEEYAFHGAYWHDNFGSPHSHGCINMAPGDAQWLFNFTGPTWDGKIDWLMSHWSNPGTLVIVHE